MKRFKKLISFLLCLAVISSIIPMNAFNAEAYDGSVEKDEQWVRTSFYRDSYVYPKGSSYGTTKVLVNGSDVFCLETEKASPGSPGNIGKTVEFQVKYAVSNDKFFTKAFYYYYNSGIISEYLNKVSKGFTESNNTKDNNYLIFHYVLAYRYSQILGKDYVGSWSYGLNSTQKTTVVNAYNYINNEFPDFSDSYKILKVYYIHFSESKYQTYIYVPSTRINIHKVDSVSGSDIEGATFNITFNDGNREVDRGNFTTNSSGMISVNVPPGTYKVTEVSAPSNYIKSIFFKTVTISAKGGSNIVSSPSTMKVKNTPKITLSLKKKSSVSSISYSLKGAVYGVYKNSTATTPYKVNGSNLTLTTNNSGVATYTGNIPYGTYYVKEITAPKGYEKDNTIYPLVATGKKDSLGRRIFSPKKSGSNVTGVTENPYIKLQLLKGSSNDSVSKGNNCYSLAGAVYRIYRRKSSTGAEGTICTVTTDSSGYAYYSAGDSSGKNTDTKDKGTLFYNKNSGANFVVESGYTYYAKEVVAPKGFALDTTEYMFKDSGRVSSDGIKIYRAVHPGTNQSPVDKPLDDPFAISIQKKDSVTGATTKLKGAIFRVQYYDTNISSDIDVSDFSTVKDTAGHTLNGQLKRTWYIETNNTGRAYLGELFKTSNQSYPSDEFYKTTDNVVTVPLGTIVIQEVEAPVGYEVNETYFCRRVSEEGIQSGVAITVDVEETPVNGYIGVYKKNQAEAKVAEAVYGLYTDENATEQVAKLTTTSNDTFDVFTNMSNNTPFSAEIGRTYYIKEISAPSGYTLDATIYDITPTLENTTVTTPVVQTIYEDVVKGNISVIKSSNDGVVKGIYFAVVDTKNNKEYGPIVTNSMGKASLKGLPVFEADGKTKIFYTVKELGFKVTKTSVSYKGYTWNVDISKCVKYKGVTYEGVANDVFTSSNSDIQPYSRYYYGNSTNAGSNQNGISKVITANSTVSYNFSNNVKSLYIEINKESFNNVKKGLYFNIVDINGNVVDTVVTNSEGYAKSKTLDAYLTVPNSAVCIPLKYKVVELGMKDKDGNYFIPNYYAEAYESEYVGYAVSNATGDYSITFDVYNKAGVGNIDISKSSEDGEVEGIYFRVAAFTDIGNGLVSTNFAYDQNGNQLHSIYLKVNSKGNATTDIASLNLNEFKGCEIVDIYGNTVTGFYDANGTLLGGMRKYCVSSQHMDSYLVFKIDELGYLTGKDSNGKNTYALPDRYVKMETAQVNLVENARVSYDCENILKKSSLKVQKSSEDGIVSGLWFNIKSDDGKVNINVSTDDDGFTDVLNNLEVYKSAVGSQNILVNYTITELGIMIFDEEGNPTGDYKIPNRYNALEPITVSLNYDDITVTKVVSFTNTLVTGKVTLYKKDSNGIGLGGSEWQLYKVSEGTDDIPVELVKSKNGMYKVSSSGTQETTLATDSKGNLVVSDLPFGSYYFIESKAPEGYMPYGEKIEFSISADEDDVQLDYTFTVKDDFYLSPNTGGIGDIGIYFVGILLFLGASALFILVGVNSKNKIIVQRRRFK